MGNKTEKEMNHYGNVSSFFQSMLIDVLGKRLKNIEASWVREVIYKIDNSGAIKEMVVIIEIPVGTRTSFKPENASVQTEIINGKARTHRISVRIEL